MRLIAATLVSLLLVVLTAFNGSAHAQLVTGDLQFSVVDSLGDPVPGVNAVVTGPMSRASVAGSRTVSASALSLPLAPGKVAVRLNHSAYQPVVFEERSHSVGEDHQSGQDTASATDR
jgi:hypothetical protein